MTNTLRTSMRRGRSSELASSQPAPPLAPSAAVCAGGGRSRARHAARSWLHAVMASRNPRSAAAERSRGTASCISTRPAPSRGEAFTEVSHKIMRNGDLNQHVMSMRQHSGFQHHIKEPDGSSVTLIHTIRDAMLTTNPLRHSHVARTDRCYSVALLHRRHMGMQTAVMHTLPRMASAHLHSSSSTLPVQADTQIRAARACGVRVEEVRLVAGPEQRRHRHRERPRMPRQVRRVRRQAVLCGYHNPSQSLHNPTEPLDRSGPGSAVGLDAHDIKRYRHDFELTSPKSPKSNAIGSA